MKDNWLLLLPAIVAARWCEDWHLGLPVKVSGANDFLCLKFDVQAFQEECTKDLEAAEPVIADAEAALNSLDKSSLGELKSFGSPAAEVVQASIHLAL